MILAGADAAAAALVADRLRGAPQSPLELPAGGALTIGLSVGQATHQPGEPLDALLDRADRDMYGHKPRP